MEEIQQQRPSSAPQVPQVKLILKPVLAQWEMGEDWEVLRPLSSTMYDLRVMIEEEKGINRNRIMIRMKGKVLQAARDRWTLRRLGLYDGYVVHIEPTLPGSWWWHPLEHYISKLIKELEDFLDNQPEGGMFLTDMVPQITIPPPIKQPLRTFLRMYPEHFHVFTDVRNNTMWVRRTQRLLEIPIFERYPHYLGKMKQFELPDFDWDSYQDVDDKYATNVFVSEEELQQQLAAAKAAAEPNDDEAQIAADVTQDNDLSGAPEAMSLTAAAEPSSSSKGQRSKSPTTGRKSPASASSPSTPSSSRRILATAKAASPPTTLPSGSQKSGKSSS